MHEDMIRIILASQQEYSARSRAAYSGRDSIYSTQSIAPGVAFPTNFSFLTQGISNGLTPAQTNLENGGRLSNNDMFVVMGVRFQWFATAAYADLNFLCNGTTLFFNFYGNPFFYGKPEMFPGGSCAYTTAVGNQGPVAGTAYAGAVTIADLGGVSSTINGMPSKHNDFELGWPGLMLRDNDSFSCILQNNAGAYTTLAAAAGGTGLTMTVWLDGYRIRAVR
jgi:hypothetical protein